jgi:hypothetical protein
MIPVLKIVYCLTSKGGDIYEAMTRVSLASVRLTNPLARIEIACDHESYINLRSSNSQLFHEADAIHSFPTPNGSLVYRNRYVKTRLRLLLTGPFLFLDSDTVVRKPLQAIIQHKADIAAAPNHSSDIRSEQIWSVDQSIIDSMGWTISTPYVNGGVIWYADSEAAHKCSLFWHEKWMLSVSQTGEYRDQPAFNYSLSELPDVKLHVLGHEFNAQLKMKPSLARTACIWHTYSSDGSLSFDRFAYVSMNLQQSSHSLSLSSYRSVRSLVTASSNLIPISWPIFWRRFAAILLRRMRSLRWLAILIS